MRSRSFFYASLGVLALAVAFHLGPRPATAQAPGNPVVSVTGHGSSCAIFAVTANGDVYTMVPCNEPASWHFSGNIFGGGPTPVRAESFGAVKARYR